MRKLFSLICALLLVLGANAQSLRLQKDALQIPGKLKPELPSSQHVPIKRAPMATMETYTINISQVSSQFYQEDNDAYYRLDDANGLYRFYFDIIVPTGQTDVVLGMTYIIDNMFSTYTAIYQSDGQGNYTRLGYAETATFIKTMDSDGLINISASMTYNGNTYNLTYQEELPTATDTISIVMSSAELTDYTATDGVFQFKSGNDDYYVYACFYGNQIEGTYSKNDLYLRYTSIYDYANDTARINILSGDAVITFANDTFFLDAYYLGEDSHCYHVTISCKHPFSVNEEFSYNYLNYKITGLTPATVEIVGKANNYHTDLIVPDSVSYYNKIFAVTSIGKEAFFDCDDLHSVVLGNNIELIGERAFENCDNLRSISLSESVKIIGGEAFYKCYPLASITIPHNVDSIGCNAFCACSNLKTVIWNAKKCKMYSRNNDGTYYWDDAPFASTNTSKSITNFIFGDSVTILPAMICANLSNLTQVSIPDSVTKIPVGAFCKCSALTAISLPSHLTTIGHSAFYECSSLTDIILPDSVTYIEHYAMANCTSIDSLTLPRNLKILGNYAISGCTSLTALTLPETLTSIGYAAFYDCSALTTLAIPNGVRTISDHIFNNCTALTSVILPDSLTSIGNYAFEKCSSLTTLNIPNRVTRIGAYAFEESGLTSIIIPESVNTMGDYAFNNCTRLGRVTWNAKHCADFAEYEGTPFASICKNITSFTFGDQVERIPYGLCHWMSKLTSIMIPNSVKEIGKWAFNSCHGLTSITLPDSLKIIKNGAFRNCDRLQSITIPEKVEEIQANAFIDCDSLRSVAWNASNRWCIAPDFQFDADIFPTTIERFTFGNGVQYIPHHLCKGMVNLTSIILPNSLKEIGIGAFQDCIGLTSIMIPDSLEYISRDAFTGCDSMSLVIWNARNCYNVDREITNYDSITEIFTSKRVYYAYSPFSSNVQTFIFGDNVRLIPMGICREMNRLTSMSLPNTVTYIGNYAFCDCSGLISFTMGEGVRGIDYAGFARCSNLPQIVLPNSLTHIGDYAFYKCSNLTTIAIGNNVNSVGQDAFYECERLMSIELPASVSEIGSNAFYGCSSMNKAIVHSTTQFSPECALLVNAQLDTVKVPASLFDIIESDWVYTTKKIKYLLLNSGEMTEEVLAVIRRSASTLETLDVAATSNTTLADEAFSNMYRLTTLLLPSGLERINYMAAAGCKKLRSIVIPASVTKIEESAFEDCRSMQAITFNGNNIETIGNWAFYNNHALRQIAIPAGVETIGEGAFYGCTYLENVAMPASLRNVGDNAFALCNHLTRMQVEAALPPQVAARTFFDVSRAIPVYVPDEAVNDYRSTQVWQEFYIRPISQAATGINEVYDNQDGADNMQPDGKFMQNGQFFIRKNGHVYDTQGHLIE